MSDVFISYARSTAKQAQAAAEALKALGYSVWLDDELLAHHAYTHAIEEQLTAAKAALVIWSAEAVKSEWVLSEANRAREEHKLVQVTVDGARLPMPFDQTQCADLAGWSGDASAPGWRKVIASIAEMVGGPGAGPVVADGPLPLPSKPSIAVMPFANLSGDPEQEYFADGMVAEITGALSRFKSLFVIASGSTLSFKGKGAGPQEVARQLGVRFVLEGSVRKAANRVRIAVQLTDATDGLQIWSDRFEDTLEDVFALQDSVALNVARRIEPAVQQAEVRRASARPTENLGSYDLYLRAAAASRIVSPAGVLQALDLADRAIALDAENISALRIAASCHVLIDRWGWSDDPETHRRSAVELARRLLRVGGDDSAALTSAANVIGSVEGDSDAAIALIDRAIAMNPGQQAAWAISAILRLKTGETDIAVEHLGTSMRLDPMGPGRPVQMALMAVARFAQGRFGEAVAHAKECAQRAESPVPYAFLAASCGHLGLEREANEALARYRALTSRPVEDAAQPFLGDPKDLKLFSNGIALAEGKNPADRPASG
jgi:TolB-like protein